MSYILTAIIRFYQIFISPFIGPRCRYLPTCSDYALEAIRIHGIRRGIILATRRIISCHPWGKHGLDPVPPLRNNKEEG